MEFSIEEIEFVGFCIEHLNCELGEDFCPLYDQCEKEEGKELCFHIVTKMKNNEDLDEDEKQVINFFLFPEHWKGKDSCRSINDGQECMNASYCEGKADDELPCVTLLTKLGLYQPEELQILEKEIEKIILNNLASIDWGLGEDLKYYGHQVRIPEINGRVDILLKGQTSSTLYVVELKPNIANRYDIGQLQSYVGWYEKNLPVPFQAVKGILLAKEFDNGAKYAILANPSLEARTFELSIAVRSLKT